jgi:hypothetical protein
VAKRLGGNEDARETVQAQGEELREGEEAQGLPEASEDEEAKAKKEADEKLLAEAHKRFSLAEEAESEIRSLALEDLEFRAGKQWPDAVSQERQRDGRPCLVINRIPQFIQQVTNDQRQNRPSIKVHPVDSQGRR